MKTLGLVFSNIHDHSLPELTDRRTIASVPIVARYRMIDFILSGMSNANIHEVGIITKTKYHSLMQHVSGGKDWDLDRKNAGITIIAPFVEAGSGPLYANRLEALQNAVGFIETHEADYIFLTDCDLLGNIHYDEVVEAHEESGADITAVYKKATFSKPLIRDSIGFTVDNDRVTSISILNELKGDINFCMNQWVMKKTLLLDIIRESMIYGYKSFSRDVLPRQISKLNVNAHEFTGYLGSINSLNSYFNTNMDVLNYKVRAELFEQENYPI